MASLKPQTDINPIEYFFHTAFGTRFAGSTIFGDMYTNAQLVVIVSPTTSGVSYKDASGSFVNRLVQAADSTKIFMNPSLLIPVMTIRTTVTDLRKLLRIGDYDKGYILDFTPPSTDEPGIIQTNDGTGVIFLDDGSINTSDTFQVGYTSSNATVVVGPAADYVQVYNDAYRFVVAGTEQGGLYSEEQSVTITQGSDPLNTGAAIIVGASVMRFGKNIDAKNGTSITAQGNIISTVTATDVGGNVTLKNGNYSLNMQATGDVPTGTGGTITSYNNGVGVASPLTLSTGKNSSIVGASDGVLNLTATGTININAPQVTISGSLFTIPVWYYQTTVDQTLNGGDGDVCVWGRNSYLPPTYSINPMNSAGQVWTTLRTGVYFICVSVKLYGTNPSGNNTLVLQRSSGAGPQSVGTFMMPGTSTISMRTIVTLTAGDELAVRAVFDNGVQVLATSGWSLEYLAGALT